MASPKNSRREMAMAALISSPTVRDAAKASGISESSLWVYLQDPDFSQEYEDKKGAIVAVAAERLRSRLDSATETVHSIMTDDTAPPQVRISAARMFFEYAAKYTDLSDVQARIAALEAAQEERKA